MSAAPTSGAPTPRGVFDEDADLYDRVRPDYPVALFDDLAKQAGVGPGCRLLEIGPGTGKATVELARRGCHITAVELGANLAKVTARNLAAVRRAGSCGEFGPAAEIVVSTFEAWPLPDESFDVVIAATAYHWLDPTVRVAKIAQALRTGGMLAVVETHHVAGGDADFFVDVQACYERWDPTTTPGFRQPEAADVPQDADTDHSGLLFASATFHRYEWEQTYERADYLDLLMTYSNHRAMPEPARSELLGCIAKLIDSRYGGRVTKHYLTQLWLARRRP
jgi:SAM-dependent methyltransferase